MRTILTWILIIISLLITGCCSTTIDLTPPPLGYSTMAESLQPKTVALVREIKGKLRPYCTGVWVSRDTFLTAAHCVDVEMDGLESFFNFSPEGELVSYLTFNDVKENDLLGVEPKRARPAHIYVFDRSIDLALVVVNTSKAPKNHPIANVSYTNQHVGDKVHIMGHPIGYWWTYVPGYLSSVRNMTGPHEKNIKVFQVSSSAWFGVSGGGMFNERGELIGICSFLSRQAPSLTFFVHQSVVNDFLVKNKIIKV